MTIINLNSLKLNVPAHTRILEEKDGSGTDFYLFETPVSETIISWQPQVVFAPPFFYEKMTKGWRDALIVGENSPSFVDVGSGIMGLSTNYPVKVGHSLVFPRPICMLWIKRGAYVISIIAESSAAPEWGSAVSLLKEVLLTAEVSWNKGLLNPGDSLPLCFVEK